MPSNNNHHSTSNTSSSFMRRTMSDHHYGDDSQSASDQDDLVGSTDMDDDDLSDTEEIQFTYCNSSNGLHHPDLDNELCAGGSNDCCCSANPTATTGHPNHDPTSGEHAICDRATAVRLRLQLCGWAATLAVSAFALLIWFPLYFQQLNASDAALGHQRHLNAYGAVLFVTSLTTVGFFAASLIAAAVRKWDDKVYILPLPWKRLVTISILSGVASTTILICSYQRVVCHLQDPLKGFILAFAVVFYFLFCKRVMGLQKIFSATTSVVGLFISVDYGLCDAFRCRGIEVPPSSTTAPTTGWQSRAVWTIVYIAGLALWTLHLSLLEGDVVSSYEVHRGVHPNRLLATVSRMVSIASDEPNKSETIKPLKRKPKALIVAAWIHLIALFVVVPVGLIDVIPGSGALTSWDHFWPSTVRTFLCHLNIKHDIVPHPVEQRARQQATLEFLSNLTPGSLRYNETVQKLRRPKRTTHTSTPNEMPNPYVHPATPTLRRLNESLHETVVNGTVHLNAVGGHSAHQNRRHNPTAAHPTATHHPTTPEHNAAPSKNDSASESSHKINSEKYMRKYRNYIKYKHHMAGANLTTATMATTTAAGSGVHNPTPIKVSQLVLNNMSRGMDEISCWPIARGSLVFSCIYVAFMGSAIHFLFETESAVFTVAVMSAALPLGGIFWSFFELTTSNGIATIIWAPEVTGELICSLLGMPIVVLGLCLFASAHINDAAHRQRMYTSLAS